MEEATESRKAEPRHPEIPAGEAKDNLGELLARAGFGNERIVITRHGKQIAALIGIRDLETLDGAA